MATLRAYVKGDAKTKQGLIDWDNDTIKVALLSSSYIPDLTNHDFFDDVSLYEITGTGYTQGGNTLTGVTVSSSSNVVSISANNVQWTSAQFTFRYAVIYKDTGIPSTSPLLALVDAGSDQTVNGTLTIQWSGGKILETTVTIA